MLGFFVFKAELDIEINARFVYRKSIKDIAISRSYAEFTD